MNTYACLTHQHYSRRPACIGALMTVCKPVAANTHSVVGTRCAHYMARRPHADLCGSACRQRIQTATSHQKDNHGSAGSTSLEASLKCTPSRLKPSCQFALNWR